MSNTSKRAACRARKMLREAFKISPTTSNYVALRRKHPTEIIEIAITGGLDWLYDNEKVFKDFNIPMELVASVLDADYAAISELCLLLMERLVARDQATKAGGTHLVSRRKVISDHVVNNCINAMLDSLEWNENLVLPRDLIVLIRHQLGGVSVWQREKESEQRICSREAATLAAAKIALSGEEPSLRAIGKAVGVNATTVMRWFAPDVFRKLKELKKVTKSARAIKAAPRAPTTTRAHAPLPAGLHPDGHALRVRKVG
jgi:hypothetical protein